MYIPQDPAPIQRLIPIEALTQLSDRQLKTLKAHWIVSIPELLALEDLAALWDQLAALLETDEAGLQALFAAARAQLPKLRDAGDNEDEALLTEQYAAGALLPPSALRAEVTYERIPIEETPPPALSYSDELPPIRNQGVRGSCVAHAAAAVREFMEVQRLKHRQADFDPETVDFSEQFIYWWCKEQDGLPDVSGTYPYLGMQCLVEAGVAREKTWPYNPNPKPGNEGQGPPPQKALKEAPKYRLQRVIHLRPDDIDSMKAALMQGKSVMITIPMFESWFHSRTTRRFGKINLPLPDEADIGAHALALIGYVDDDTAPGGGYFILRNAWKPWALKNPLGKGLGTIPYDFIRQYNTIADTGQWLIPADVYIRDNEQDGGQTPSRGLAFNSPDIWNRLERDDETKHQAPRPGHKNWLYVRAWNLGPDEATEVRAEVFAAPVSPSVWPEMWRPIGTLRFEDIPAEESRIAALAWKPDDKTPVRFLVRLHADEDPAQHQWAVRYDNNIAQKNLLQLSLRPGAKITLDFPLFGLPGELTLRHIHVDRKAFSGGRIGLKITEAQDYRQKTVEHEDQILQRFSGQATERRNAQLSISLAPTAKNKDGGRIIISQQYSDVLIGRMMIEVTVDTADVDA